MHHPKRQACQSHAVHIITKPKTKCKFGCILADLHSFPLGLYNLFCKMPICFIFLQLITSVRYSQLLCKADLVFKTLKEIIKCLLEIEHSLQLHDIRHRTLYWDTEMLTPLFKGADSPPLLHAKAAQLFLLFI